MKRLRSTGEAAQLLGTTEPKLGDLVRRGKIKPRPLVVAGRRFWSTDLILQAAHVLDIPAGDFACELSKTNGQDQVVHQGTLFPHQVAPESEGTHNQQGETR